jgi:vacuolar protein sorting-associated protein 16
LSSGGPFTHIAASPNGRSIALLTASNHIWVITSDFQRKILEFDASTLESSSVIQLGWCGSDAVLLTFPTSVILLAPGGETVEYTYMSTPHLVTETDGARILTSMECDMVQRVPESSESVFRPGSTAPAAFLFDASESFSRKSGAGGGSGGGGFGAMGLARGRVDETIRGMKPDLAAAVYACIDAAGREWDATWQRKLLNVGVPLFHSD